MTYAQEAELATAQPPLPDLPTMFFERARSLQKAPALYYCDATSKRWVQKDWATYLDEVQTVADWLQRQGVRRGERVLLIAANRPEWLVSDLAVLSIGAVSVPVYATASASDVAYIAEHSEATCVIVDRAERLRPLAGLRFKAILSFEASATTSWGLGIPPASLATVLAEHKGRLAEPVLLDGDEIATIIYTSGTTGRPKGVVHSHRNFAWGFKVDETILVRTDGGSDRFFSFLPLSHVAERIMVEMGSILCGAEVAFARSIDTLAEDLRHCRPTVLLCVPRLWEKFYEAINASVATAHPLRRAIFRLARRLGERRLQGNLIIKARDRHLLPMLSDWLYGRHLRQSLGLDRCRILATGAAPTRPEVLRFFAAFGLMIREVYGLTENFTFGTLNGADVAAIGTTGSPFPYSELRLGEDGEILMRAPWMFLGYYKDSAATHAVLSPDGWFATGDLGALDEAGRLRIVGRKKELLKTSGGKYVAPVPIEDRLKSMPFIKDAMIVGDSYKYCIALVALEEGVASSKEEQRAKLARCLAEVNASLASFETIKQVGVLCEGFSVASGHLTPTLKLRRSVVVKEKTPFIESVYRAQETVVFEQ